MSAINEILASGQYTDRRGREWHHSAFLPRWVTSSGFNYFGPVYAFVYEDEMRLLIERDMHRDECTGLGFCLAHPVPHVIAHEPHIFEVFGARSSSTLNADRFARTLPEAMDAACALAVGA